jgi:hypothetical protein
MALQAKRMLKMDTDLTLLELLENDLLILKTRKNHFKGLERFIIEKQIDQLDVLLRVYKREKKEMEEK